MNLSIEIYTIFIECILVFYFLHKTLRPSYSSVIKTTVLYVVLFLSILLATLFTPMIVRISIIFIYLSFVYSVCFKAPIVQSIYEIILFFVSSLFADLISGLIVSHLGFSVDEILGVYDGRFIYNTIAKIIHLLLLVILYTLTQSRLNHRALLEALPLIACNLASTVVLCTQFDSFFIVKDSSVFLRSTICILIINIVICIYTESVKKSYELQKREICVKEQLVHQEKYYQDLIIQQNESRALWHDIKKYMLAMEALVAENQEQEASDQLTSLRKKVSHLEQTIFTGNTVIDGILNYASEKAKSNNIPVKFDLWVDTSINISAVDLYIIIGNTFDNAIEACSSIPTAEKPTIHCILHQKNQLLFYEISNPMPDAPAPKAGSIHGYGLENVKNCVNRNNGLISINTQNNTFCISITLNI